LDWDQVLEELDYPDFILYDAEGLMIIINAYRTGVKVSDRV
jgi:hypothetical protein